MGITLKIAQNNGVGETSSKYGYPGGGEQFIKDLQAHEERYNRIWDAFVLFMQENAPSTIAVCASVSAATIGLADVLNEGTGAGRGFAVSGGVAKAVTDLVHEKYPDMEIQTARAEGLRDCRKLMALAKAGKYKGYLLEGMGCPGGCVAGPGTILAVDKAAKMVEKYSSDAKTASPMESPYRDRGEHLD